MKTIIFVITIQMLCISLSLMAQSTGPIRYDIVFFENVYFTGKSN
jgi:hypothetical protein